MLLSPTLPYSCSFPWQITEQQFHPVGLTLEKLGLLPKRAGPLFSFSLVFFFFLFPTQVYSNSFFCSNLFSSSGPDAVAEVPVAWCYSGLCSSAFPQLLAALVPPCPQVSPGLFQEQHLPISQLSALSSSLQPEDDLPFAPFQYFLPKY